MKLRLLRLQANLTLEDLTQSTGLTRSYLSKLERGLSNPSVAAGLKLAKALGVTVEELFGEAASTDSVSITSHNQHAQLAEGESQLVAGTMPGHNMLAFRLRPNKKPVRRNPTTRHVGEEILYVLKGDVTFRVGSQTFQLQAGDCAHFNSAMPHAISASGAVVPEVLLVVSGADPGHDSAVDGER